MTHASTPAIPAALDEGVMAFVFGDEDVDPGQLVTDGANVPGFVAHLEALERDLTLLKQATGQNVSDSEARARLQVLRDETIRWQASHPAADGANVPNVPNVVDLAGARQRLRARLTTYVGIVVAAAAAVLLVARPWSGEGKTGAAPPRELTAQLVGSLTEGVGVESGHGFSGPLGPGPRDRGFLLGGILDLSDPKPDGSPRSGADLQLAQTLVERVLVGLDTPETPAERLQRARGGCGALLSDATERALCESGLSDYRARRDAALAE
jgi:hypothetical protein